MGFGMFLKTLLLFHVVIFENHKKLIYNNPFSFYNEVKTYVQFIFEFTDFIV